MNKATFDPAKRLDLYFRINRNGSKAFIFYNASGTAYPITDIVLAMDIKMYAGGKSFISIPLSIENNVATASITSDISNVNEGEYFWELIRVDTGKTWLNGKAYFHNGLFDGVNDTSSGITITDSGDTIQITITESGASSSSTTNIQVVDNFPDDSSNTGQLILVNTADADIIGLLGPRPFIAISGGWADFWRYFFLGHDKNQAILGTNPTLTSAGVMAIGPRLFVKQADLFKFRWTIQLLSITSIRLQLVVGDGRGNETVIFDFTGSGTPGHIQIDAEVMITESDLNTQYVSGTLAPPSGMNHHSGFAITTYPVNDITPQESIWQIYIKGYSNLASQLVKIQNYGQLFRTL